MSNFDKNPDYDEIFTQIAGRAGGKNSSLYQ
jgi:hypothetical protein